jgi:hypothetical protein
VNSHGRFLEVLEYGAGGWRSFIIISEGQERRGWRSCIVQMRKVVHYFEKKDSTGSRYGKKYNDSLLMPRSEDKGRRSFVEVMLGKGHSQETVSSSRGTVDISGKQKVSVTEVCDMKEEQRLPRFFGVQVGKDNLIFSSLDG